MGPRYAFPSFPELPASVPLTPALLYGIPNAMPSLHVGTALLIFFLARPSRWLRWITGVFLLMTILAVFATGEHYMVDAVVAIPYSLMVMAYCSKTGERKPVILVGAGMLTVWLLVLRYGGGNFWISWGLVTTTIVIGILTERRFAKVLAEPLPSAALPAA
jgi:glucose-6-phosphate-specific signal transduction histidine kinase